jgi:hypothetical protein
MECTQLCYSNDSILVRYLRVLRDSSYIGAAFAVWCCFSCLVLVRRFTQMNAWCMGDLRGEINGVEGRLVLERLVGIGGEGDCFLSGVEKIDWRVCCCVYEAVNWTALCPCDTNGLVSLSMFVGRWDKRRWRGY